MAWPDLSDIRDRVRSVLNETTATFWADAQLNRFINDGERDVAIKTCCLENIDAATTTSGSRLVAFAGYGVNYAEYIPASGNPIGLVKIMPKQLGRVPTNGTTPQYWLTWGSSVVIDPIPAATHNLNLYVSDYPLAEMSNDTDEPSIPADCHELITQFAIYRALLRDRKFARAAGFYSVYINNVNAAHTIFVQKYRDRLISLKLPDRVETADGRT